MSDNEIIALIGFPQSHDAMPNEMLKRQDCSGTPERFVTKVIRMNEPIISSTLRIKKTDGVCVKKAMSVQE